MIEVEVKVGGLKDGSAYPYCAIKIPAEKFKEIKNRRIEFYEGNEGIYLDCVDNNGNDVGDKMIYLVWR